MKIQHRAIHQLNQTECEVMDFGANEDCGSCGADIGPSRYFVWHYDYEDCRAIHEPIDNE